MLESINSLFTSFNENGISYCHWKSTNHLDSTMKGLTDLDVLFDECMAKNIEKLLSESGFKSFETVFLRSYPGIHDYICLDKSGTWVHLHLHYILNLGDRWVKAYRFPIEKEILSRAQYVSEYNSYLINPYDELLLHCLRMSLKFYSPFNKKSVFNELYYLKSKCTGNIPDYRNIFQYFRSLKEILDYVLTNDNINIKTANKISHSISDELTIFRRFGLIRFVCLTLQRKIYRYYIEFRRRKLSNFSIGRRNIPTGGKIIAFVGIDGSGKTTTLSYIKHFFSVQMNVCSVFLGNGKSGASWYRRILFSLYGTKAKFRNKNKTLDALPHTNFKISSFYALWILLCLFDKKKNLKKALSGKANGSLVLSDRWPQAEVIGTFDGPRINVENPKNLIVRYVRKREQKFLLLTGLIKPDMIVRFKIRPEVSIFRKPDELTFNEAQINSNLLYDIKWGSARIADINANESIEQVNKAVRDAIWSLIADVKQ